MCFLIKLWMFSHSVMKQKAERMKIRALIKREGTDFTALPAMDTVGEARLERSSDMVEFRFMLKLRRVSTSSGDTLDSVPL